MTSAAKDDTSELLNACGEFWSTYSNALLRIHLASGRTLQEPIRDRNLGTTASEHVAVFERFWRKQLSSALGVPESEVGSRQIRFRPHRSKKFDVCWPMTGEPRILISVKSMQNAYRNLTNRIEEAIGDSAVLRLYKSNAVFGFFFFILDGRVASGEATQGVSLRTTGAKGVAPFLELIEEGGDFFELSDVDRYRGPSQSRTGKGRQNTIKIAEQSLLDMVRTDVSAQSSIHYDGIALLPTRIERAVKRRSQVAHYQISTSPVDEWLDHRWFLSRLIATAQVRGLIK